MAGELTPEFYGGNDINSATYKAIFSAAREGARALSSFQAEAVESERPGRFPVHVRQQPTSRDIYLEIQVLNDTQANHETLKKWFDPTAGEQYLVATDAAAASRRILCQSLIIEPFTKGLLLYRVVLRAATGVWEANALETDTEVVVASGQTWAISNAGNHRAYPKFTLTPNTVMSDANYWVRRRRATLVNRSELPLTDPVGDGYPIDLAKNALDTDALNTAAKLQADLDDLRVIHNGRDINRWPDPAGDDPTTKVWANLQLRPRKTATIAVAMASGASPANGASVTVSNAAGLAGWPQSGFFLIDTECFQYSSRTETAFVLDATGGRGARNTTAASHSASATAYWVEHPWLDLIYSYTAATNPAPPDDRKPLLDMALSLNTEHHWTSEFLVPTGTRRSRGWRPTWTDDGFTSRYIRLYESGGTLLFEDALPVAGKPNYNNLIMDCPVPIDAAAAAVELDYTIGRIVRLHGYLLDQDGNESLLINKGVSAASTNQQFQPAALAYRLWLNGRNGSVTGHISDDSQLLQVDNVDGRGAVVVLTAPTDIVQIYLRIKHTNTSTADLDVAMFSGVTVDPDFHVAASGLTILNASLPSVGVIAWLSVSLSAPMKLPPGTYNIRVKKSVASGVIETSNSNPRGHHNIYSTNSSAPIVSILQRSPGVLLLTTLTDAQADAPVESGDLITLDNFELNLNSARTPEIVLGAEETMMLLNCRLQNDTTGQYLDLGLWPCKLTKAIEVDCEARTIRDLETGRNIPFILAEGSSDPEHWLYLQPGNNTLSLTQVGLVSVDVTTDWRSRWL